MNVFDPFRNISMTFSAVKELFRKDKSSKEIRSIVTEISSKKGSIKNHEIPLVNYALKLWKENNKGEEMKKKILII